MKQNIIKRLEDSIPSLSKSLRMVADFIIKNPMEVSFSTIDQVAHKVGVSTATIIRLAVSLGFSGYTEFQKELKEMLKHQSHPFTKLELSMKKDNIQDNHICDTIKQLTTNISSTCDDLNDELIIKAERLISSANNLFFYGNRSCFSIAHYLYYDLNRIFGNGYLLSDEDGMLADRISRITKGDVIIVATMPRYVKNVLLGAKLAKARGAAVIAITDSYLSPLVDYANVMFTVMNKSLGFHNSLTSAMLVADILISRCTVLNADKAKSNLNQILEITKELGVHCNE